MAFASDEELGCLCARQRAGLQCRGTDARLEATRRLACIAASRLPNHASGAQPERERGYKKYATSATGGRQLAQQAAVAECVCGQSTSPVGGSVMLGRAWLK